MAAKTGNKNHGVPSRAWTAKQCAAQPGHAKPDYMVKKLLFWQDQRAAKIQQERAASAVSQLRQVSPSSASAASGIAAPFVRLWQPASQVGKHDDHPNGQIRANSIFMLSPFYNVMGWHL